MLSDPKNSRWLGLLAPRATPVAKDHHGFIHLVEERTGKALCGFTVIGLHDHSGSSDIDCPLCIAEHGGDDEHIEGVDIDEEIKNWIPRMQASLAAQLDEEDEGDEY